MIAMNLRLWHGVRVVRIAAVAQLSVALVAQAPMSLVNSEGLRLSVSDGLEDGLESSCG
jgi:hypothetical protein